MKSIQVRDVCVGISQRMRSYILHTYVDASMLVISNVTEACIGSNCMCHGLLTSRALGVIAADCI